MGRLRPRKIQDFRFTQSEIDQMEKIFQDAEVKSWDQGFCQALSEKFNRVSGRAGKTAIQSKQVQSWFQNKQQAEKPEDAFSPVISKELVVLPEPCPLNSEPGSFSDMVADEKIPDLSELEFEARSSKDGAWYDVATFMSHRILESGEPEVRVRFVGFGAEEDEWVNVKKAIRLRSLPFEPSECQMINSGDRILCLRERRDQAIYFDAHILDVQRRRHDIRGCRCLFLIHYDHDHIEETVHLRRLCRTVH